MCFILFPVSFSMKKFDHNVKLNWLSMIFIFGVISIIIQKNTLCTNKIRVIYFWQNYVIFLPKYVHFFFWGGEGGGGNCLPLLPSPSLCGYGCRPQVCNFVNPIQDGGAQKRFSSVTSANVGISLKNFLTFSFNSFATLA